MLLITYAGTAAHFHSTVHQTGRFYCLIPAVCSLHHKCRSLQSCRLHWRGCVDHLWEYQDHHSQQLGRIRKYMPCSVTKNSEVLTNHLHTITSCQCLYHKLINHSLTIPTLCSNPSHITGASVRSCAGPSILTGTGTDG